MNPARLAALGPLAIDGAPVSCGSTVELRLPGDRWLPARYELHDGAPVLHVALGHTWERRFEARPFGPSWSVWDLRRDVWVTREERDDEGWIMYPEIERNTYAGQLAADEAARLLDRLLCPRPEVVISVSGDMQLRRPVTYDRRRYDDGLSFVASEVETACRRVLRELDRSAWLHGGASPLLAEGRRCVRELATWGHRLDPDYCSREARRG